MATVFKHRLVTLTLMLCSVAPAYAGVNDFFGSSIPTVGSDSPSINGTSGSGAAQSMPSELAPQSPSTSSHSDYTDDEKRMRKKYKTSIKHAETLIAKGDKLIKDGESKKTIRCSRRAKSSRALVSVLSTISRATTRYLKQGLASTPPGLKNRRLSNGGPPRYLAGRG
ncbi:MAG: hypothetical protein IPL73_26970 [Candidatus Obscuribacter sp.]|nr:hypothetical protein [Candidatus Obscuribacter sp.]